MPAQRRQSPKTAPAKANASRPPPSVQTSLPFAAQAPRPAEEHRGAPARAPLVRRAHAEATPVEDGDAAITALRAALLAWYRAHHRQLPWRRTRDSYAVWLSEIMLQQTRVDTVIPYYQRFLARFPTVNALAGAPIDDVLALWSGLGYYARGRNLHRAAQAVVALHGGALPRDEAALLALPGVGRYTAGAIRSIAYDEPAPILDGNVVRVLSRLFVLEGDPKVPANTRRLWALAERFAPGEAPGELNQGLMELGATVCTPAAPDCHLCPLRERCAARARGESERFPEIPSRKASPQVHGVAALCTRIIDKPSTSAISPKSALLLDEGKDIESVLLVQRPGEGLLGGLWELPGREREHGEQPAQALREAVTARLGVDVEVGERAADLTHVFTHKKLRLTVYRCTLLEEPVSTAAGPWRWMRPAELLSIPLSRLMARALAAGGIPVPAAKGPEEEL